MWLINLPCVIHCLKREKKERTCNDYQFLKFFIPYGYDVGLCLLDNLLNSLFVHLCNVCFFLMESKPKSS